MNLDAQTMFVVTISVAAVLDFTDLKTGETRTLRPVYMIMNDRSQQFVPTEAKDWGLIDKVYSTREPA